MVYIKLFQTEQEKQACTDKYEYLSYTVESDKVNIHPHDYSQDYLTFVAKSSGTFKFSGSSSGETANTIQYSTDNGETWSELAQTFTINVNEGDKIVWKGEMLPYSSKGIGTFSASTALFDIEGNIMSLLYGDNFVGQVNLSGKNYVFGGLFLQNSRVVNANSLILPATTLANYCYNNMFNRCTSLVTAPQLPATTLAQYCYQSMFLYCTSLVTAPQLPATTLGRNCYMYMFQGCTSLTTAPQLPATTLATQCYESMFEDCTKLNYIKAMFTTTPSASYTNNWVSGVAASGTFVKNSAATWDVRGVNGIPNGWTVQDA